MAPRYLVILSDGGDELKPVTLEAKDEDHAKDIALHQNHGYTISSVEPEFEVRYPEVEVGESHILHHPISAVRTALRLAKVPREHILEFTNEAIDASERPDGIVEVAKKWVTIT